MSHSLEKVFRIYNDKEGVYFQVSPGPDSPDDFICIRTQGANNEDWYGKMYFNITKEEAKLLAIALNDLAYEVK